MSNFWIEGALHKPEKGKYWEVEAASLFIYTQGSSKKEALFMIKDAVFSSIYDLSHFWER